MSDNEIEAFDCEGSESFSVSEEEICEHCETTNIDGSKICDECGLKLDEDLLDNENHYYGSADTRYSKDPTRHHRRKEEDRNLRADLEPLEFPQRIIERANDYYQDIIENKIYRAKNRLSIVFACTFNAYIDFGEPQAANDLAKRFELDRKGISNGLKTFAYIFRNRPHKKYIQPLDLIPKLLSDLGVTDQHTYLEDIKRIYEYVESRSQTIRTSIPQSVAAGLVYFYLKLKDYPITRAQYSKIVQLTEITFTKIANDACDIIGHKVKL